MNTEAIISLDNQTSIPALFRFRAQTLKNKVAMREKHLGIWRTFSWNQYYSNSARLGWSLDKPSPYSPTHAKSGCFSISLPSVLVVFPVVSMQQIRRPKSFIFVNTAIRLY